MSLPIPENIREIWTNFDNFHHNLSLMFSYVFFFFFSGGADKGRDMQKANQEISVYEREAENNRKTTYRQKNENWWSRNGSVFNEQKS